MRREKTYSEAKDRAAGRRPALRLPTRHASRFMKNLRGAQPRLAVPPKHGPRNKNASRLARHSTEHYNYTTEASRLEGKSNLSGNSGGGSVSDYATNPALGFDAVGTQVGST